MERLKSHAKVVDVFCAQRNDADSLNMDVNVKKICKIQRIEAAARNHGIQGTPNRRREAAHLDRRREAAQTPESMVSHERGREAARNHGHEVTLNRGDEPNQDSWKDTIIRYHQFVDYCFAGDRNGSLPVSQPVSVIVKDNRIVEDSNQSSPFSSALSPTSSFLGVEKDAGDSSPEVDAVKAKRRRSESLGDPGVKTRRSHRSPIPDEKKDHKYWERRKRNNEAAKRSREARRYKELEVTKRCKDLQSENEELRSRLRHLEERNIELDTALKVCKRLLASKNILAL